MTIEATTKHLYNLGDNATKSSFTLAAVLLQDVN